MGQKPISERAWMETRGALWASIRRLGTFTARELRGETRCSVSQVQDYLHGLTRAGYLVAQEIPGGNGKPTLRYTLQRDTGIEPPRVRRDGTPILQGLGREQMWQTIRMLGEFTWLDLAVQASTEEVPVKPESAREYCHYLALAGYLAVVREGKGMGKGGIQTLYRFLPARNTGPKPPMIQRVKQLYDPNLGQVVWSSEEGGHDEP